MSDPLTVVERSARTLEIAKAQRDTAIIDAAQAGFTLGVIGRAAGMSRQAVHALLGRHGFRVVWQTRGRSGAYVIEGAQMSWNPDADLDYAQKQQVPRDYFDRYRPEYVPKEQLCWLIERGQALNHAPTVWWTADESIGWGGWTDDPHKAMKYTRRADAEKVVLAHQMGQIQGDLSDWAHVVEHGFVG